MQVGVIYGKVAEEEEEEEGAGGDVGGRGEQGKGR